ncbi:carboxypeptidase-like regulatory domain-containing protein [Pedobacter immunditicola]|uniref:carboxypeptidase-like regulatory domain-containing protein n=1 Tax=Pedobacter immunditicola TaxID=3133440 RepID=UPI0030B74347
MVRNLLFTMLLLCFCVKNPLVAQTTQASIFGIVTDQQNKTIPGAIVQVKNNSTGFTTKTATDSKGGYTFKELPLGGPYSVKVSYMGFGEQTRSGYTLNFGDAVRINVEMQEAAQNLETVEVVQT